MATRPPTGRVTTRGTSSAESSPREQSKMQSLAIPAQQTQQLQQPQLTMENIKEGVREVVKEMIAPLQDRMDKLATAVQDNEVKITSSIKAATADLIVVMDDKIKGVTEQMEVKNTEIRQDILLALKGLVIHVGKIQSEIVEFKEGNQALANNMGQVQEKMERAEIDITTSQYREMEFALRIRGLKEQKQEDIKKRITPLLALILGWPEKETMYQIDKIYRVNSWVARQKRLPRDIVIYLTTRSTRNDILQAAFGKKLEIEGQEVMVMKEIPPKMLHARRDYHFLVDELKKRQIQYRWDVPAGLVVTFSGEKYRLNTILKAREFYTRILKAGTPRSPETSKIQSVEESTQDNQVLQASASATAESSTTITQQEDLLQFNPQPVEQRQTRAGKRKEEQRLLQLQMMEKETLQPQVEGGAKSKDPMDLLFEEISQKLTKSRDGR